MLIAARARDDDGALESLMTMIIFVESFGTAYVVHVKSTNYNTTILQRTIKASNLLLMERRLLFTQESVMSSRKKQESAAAMATKSSSFAERWDTVADQVEARWDDLCDWFAAQGDAPQWIADHFLRRLTVEAPVVISFCFLNVIIHILAYTIMPGLNHFLAVQDTLQLTSFMQYPRLITHIFAHDGLAHIKGNMTHLLLVGPSCEHVYGSIAMLKIFGLVAIVSALAHIFVGGSNTHQMGASGIVFSTILLNSLVAAEVGKIPVSFVLTAGLWITDEVFKFFFGRDGVSHHAHLTGAIVGTVAGYYFHGDRAKEELKRQEKQAMDQPPAMRPWFLKTMSRGGGTKNKSS